MRLGGHCGAMWGRFWRPSEGAFAARASRGAVTTCTTTRKPKSYIPESQSVQILSCVRVFCSGRQEAGGKLDPISP
jgi:hypothetical protein